MSLILGVSLQEPEKAKELIIVKCYIFGCHSEEYIHVPYLISDDERLQAAKVILKLLGWKYDQIDTYIVCPNHAFRF